jgi:hypothetical protein
LPTARGIGNGGLPAHLKFELSCDPLFQRSYFEIKKEKSVCFYFLSVDYQAGAEAVPWTEQSTGGTDKCIRLEF